MSVTDAPTRAEQPRSVATRSRILQAAVEALVGDGYSGATTVRIQELAGVSRGRLLHHFPSRDDLLVASVEHLTQAQMELLTRPRTWPRTAGRRIDAAVRRMWEEFGEDYFWASAELWLAARTNPRLRDALEPHERRLGAHIRTRTDSFFGPALTAAPDYPAMREVLLSSMRGAALTYSFLQRPPATEPQLAHWIRLAHRILLPEA